ncbi:MAG TPA: hypothetical protein VE178_15080 [Silvibacterium sp.]|nr:hypothetical protein [Silvibacterium sp.]
MPLPYLWAQNTAFDRAASLRHGINLSGWFAGSRDLSAQHFDTFTGEADLKLIHDMGFDSVRLGVEPSLIARHGSLTPANPEALAGDYRGNFGVVERTDTQITPDPAILKALGLHADVQPVTIGAH